LIEIPPNQGFIVPETRDEAIAIIREFQFRYPHLDTELSDGQKKQVELLVRRWIGIGYLLDFLILGKGDRNKPPLTFPGVRAEENEAEYLAALLELCSFLQTHSPFFQQYKMRQLYTKPMHLWIGLIYGQIGLDLEAPFHTKRVTKPGKLRTRRRFIKYLTHKTMPAPKEYGFQPHWENFFRGYCDRNWKKTTENAEYLILETRVIDSLRAAIDRVEETPQLKISFAKGKKVYVQEKPHPIALEPTKQGGIRIGTLPKLPNVFWLTQKGGKA
jgi:hypothetical protein